VATSGGLLRIEGERFVGGLGDDDVVALADSFALASCDLRTPLVERLPADLSGGTTTGGIHAR
jgi:hypothetical protein